MILRPHPPGCFLHTRTDDIHGSFNRGTTTDAVVETTVPATDMTVHPDSEWQAGLCM